MPREHIPRKNKSNLAKALAAAAEAGLVVARFEISKGKIIVFASQPEQDDGREATSNDLRKLL